MLAAMLILAAPATCARCNEPKNLHWEKAIVLGAQRAKEKDTKSIRTLVLRESGNAPSRHARNKRSTAYGYGQFLNMTWAGTGIKKTDCGVCQIEAMIRYCRNRYGSPAKALTVWRKQRWY